MLVVVSQLNIFGRAWDFHAEIAGSLLIIIGTQVVGLGLCGHAYGMYYMGERDPWFERMRERFRLESGLLLGFGLLFCGLVAAGYIVWQWVDRGFGELGEERLAVAGRDAHGRRRAGRLHVVPAQHPGPAPRALTGADRRRPPRRVPLNRNPGPSAPFSGVTDMSKLLAIVPAYNESGAIAGTVTDVLDNAPGFDVVVVDDGSTDDTGTVARRAGASVIHHPFNIGIGGAVQSGYQYALDNGYDVAVQVDGDGQHDARYIPELLQVLRSDPRLNMVSGSRFIGDGEAGYQSSATRRLGIRLFSGLLSRITGRAVTDPTSGFRMTDRRGIELFARDYPHDYPEVEAVLMLHHHRLVAAEVPVQMRERQAGESSINSSRSAYYMIKVMLAILLGLLRARPTVEAGDAAAVSAEHGI